MGTMGREISFTRIEFKVAQKEIIARSKGSSIIFRYLGSKKQVWHREQSKKFILRLSTG